MCKEDTRPQNTGGINCHDLLLIITTDFILHQKNVLFVFTEYDKNLCWQLYLIRLPHISPHFILKAIFFHSNTPFLQQRKAPLQQLLPETISLHYASCGHFLQPAREVDHQLSLCPGNHAAVHTLFLTSAYIT